MKKNENVARPQSSRSPTLLAKDPKDTGKPGAGKGRMDLTGIAPEGNGVDPYFTEGHPGYEESGNSGIVQPVRSDKTP